MSKLHEMCPDAMAMLEQVVECGEVKYPLNDWRTQPDAVHDHHAKMHRLHHEKGALYDPEWPDQLHLSHAIIREIFRIQKIIERERIRKIANSN